MKPIHRIDELLIHLGTLCFSYTTLVLCHSMLILTAFKGETFQFIAFVPFMAAFATNVATIVTLVFSMFLSDKNLNQKISVIAKMFINVPIAIIFLLIAFALSS